MTKPNTKRFLSVLMVALQAAVFVSTVSAAEYDDADEQTGINGAVYTMSNATSGNAILRFQRKSGSALVATGSFSTGGVGTGGGLGNQGALITDQSKRWIYSVNAGSNDISVFSVKPEGLVLVDKVPSGGTRPISLTIDRNVLYVLNAGGDGNISGFTVQRNGHLTAMADSTRTLSGAGTNPAQIGFSPDGGALVVTEKATNLIDTYRVDANGLADGPHVNTSVSATPFGFAFDSLGHLLVSEAVGGAVDAASVSSYKIGDDGALEVISSAVADTETAVCWVVVTKNNKYAYVSNAGSGSISAYKVARDGSIALRDEDGRTGETGAGSTPLDIAFSSNDRFLYTLNNGTHTIGAFQVQKNGALVAVPGASGLPVGTNGLVAY